LPTATKYITNIRNKSAHIPYYGQWLWPWNVFKWLCVIPLLWSGLYDGRSAVTSLEHNRTDITQLLLLAFGEQRQAGDYNPSRQDYLNRTAARMPVTEEKLFLRSCL
jgi:hypothetical protein